MNNKKYILTDETMEFGGRTLYRIKALKDIDDIAKGDLGGWIESENNLSQTGDCWVDGNAKVCENALVSDDATVCENAIINGSSCICDNAFVYGNAKINGSSCIMNNAEVYKDAIIKDTIIIGEVSLPYKDIFQHQCKNRILTAILTENDEILYTIGCQKNITKEQFIDRIYNENGGIEKNPHRKEYLKIIECVELYFFK